MSKEAAVTPATSSTPLERLNVLVGEWNVAVPDPVDPSAMVGGRTTFAWLEDQSFLIERSTVDRPEYPDGVSIIGCDDTTGQIVQSYTDSRGVYRIYQMSLDGGLWKLWREAPGFFQRFTATLSADGGTMTGAWEKSSDGVTWEHDFDLTYMKVS